MRVFKVLNKNLYLVYGYEFQFSEDLFFNLRKLHYGLIISG